MNLPISTNVPQSSAAKAAAPSQAAPDDQTSHAADPFGNVLARQISDKSAASSKAAAADASSSAADAALIKVSGKKDGKPQATDLASVTPLAGMLAALHAVPTHAVDTKLADSKAATTANDGTQLLTTAKQSPLDKLHLGKMADAHLHAGKTDAATNGTDQQFAAALHTLTGNDTAAAHVGQQDKTLLAAADATQNVAAAQQAQQLAQNNPAAATAQAKMGIDTPVHNKNWGEDFSQKITWMSSQNQQSAELHLNPPDLGPLKVVLHVSGDQASAMFTSAHAAVRDAVEQAMPRLREMMAGNGIMLGNATVSDQSPRDNGSSSNQSNRSRGQASAISGIDGGSLSGQAGIAPSSVTTSIRLHNGMVDTFA